ncbi:MAG TPA: type I-U CRISPR-associated protein Csb2 [Acidisarcina sp.]
MRTPKNRRVKEIPLILQIEYLTRIAFAARGPEGGAPDWPPQPDRIFSALVATWGARGERGSEADALKWLERQSTPRIAASKAEPRNSPVTFVPPNDKGILPQLRRRQPRRFPACLPDDPLVSLYWENAAPDAEVLEALNLLASDTSYIGHSASLTRCRFLYGDAPSPLESRSPRRRVYPGRFEELRENYKQFDRSGGKSGRPRPGDWVATAKPAESEAARSVFDPAWLVLEHTGGEIPDVRASALIAKEIHKTILSGYQSYGMGDRIPVEVSGHDLDKKATREPHLAIVPLAFAGFPYADGHLIGFALTPPRGSGLFQNGEFLGAMSKIAPHSEETGRREITLFGSKVKLLPTFEPEKRSLDSTLYTRPSTRFATVTPIVLDRHLKEKGDARQEEIVAQINSACVNIGLPEPDAVLPDKHSAIEGSPSAQPSGRSPEWMRWRLPPSLNNRFLTHAVIRFPAPVEGPVILGAGRFLGLGLCRPLEDAENEE